MFDLLDIIRKLLSQIIIGVRIIRGFKLMEELRYITNYISKQRIFEAFQVRLEPYGNYANHKSYHDMDIKNRYVFQIHITTIILT